MREKFGGKEKVRIFAARLRKNGNKTRTSVHSSLTYWER